MTDHAPHSTRRLSEWDSDFADRVFGEAARKLRLLLRPRLRSSADAEDVVQQACLKVLESDQKVENLPALLYRTAVNLAHDRQRMAARRARIAQLLVEYGDGETDPRTPEDALIARQQLDAVAGVLAALPDVQRQAWLRWQAGERQGDIAAAIGVTRRSVERYLADTLARMRCAAERETSK